MEIGLNPFVTEDGTFVLASIVDITERKRESQKFQMAVEASPTGMIMINKMGEIELANNQILSLVCLLFSTY